jgi:pimeloyl-ACP methyl ester carboxylesterase
MRRSALIGAVSTLSTAAAGAFFYGAYRRDMKRIRAGLAAGRLRADTAAGPIEYGREGSGPPVLVIHGAGGGFDQGLALGRELLGPGFDLIAPSRFGYLKTFVPDIASPAAQADAHAALLESLHVPQAIVIGVSAGAPSAIEMALRHPSRVSALILAVPRAWAPDAELSEAPLQSARVLRAVETGGDFAYWTAMHLARPSVVHFLGVPASLEAKASPTERARVSEIVRSLLPVSERVSGIANDGATTIRQWPLERVKAPTLVVSAEDDLYGTLPCARFTAAQIPGAELTVLESGGHLMVGRVAEVRARVAKFLARVDARLAAAA